MLDRVQVRRVWGEVFELVSCRLNRRFRVGPFVESGGVDDDDRCVGKLGDPRLPDLGEQKGQVAPALSPDLARYLGLSEGASVSPRRCSAMRMSRSRPQA